MRAAIVGFAYSGKSSVYRAISGVSADHVHAAQENLAAVRIPEPRLDLLERLFQPKRRTEATMEFIDLPGSAEGDVEKAGLEKHLPALRQSDLLVLVVRAFENDSVPAHQDRIDPQADLAQLRDEMLLADLTICAARIEKLDKALGKGTKDREQQRHELELLQRCNEALENEKPLSNVVRPGDEEKTLRSFGFLTQKPVVLVANIDESRIGQDSPVTDPHAYMSFAICAALEAELVQMDPADRPEFMAGYGIRALARDRIVRACFEALRMIFMLTVGPEEVRAWALARGTTALEAAGKVHTDLARGFIKAETVAYDDLQAAGNMRAAKAANKVRMEPKSYVVQDGDVITIKFNV